MKLKLHIKTMAPMDKQLFDVCEHVYIYIYKMKQT